MSKSLLADSLFSKLEARILSGEMPLGSRFHMTIARATKNDCYVRFMDFLGIRLVPPRSLYLRAITRGRRTTPMLPKCMRNMKQS